MAPVDVVIVGGGIAGLATAYELTQHGVSLAVIEKASRPGGVIRNEAIEGFLIDAGPDALLVQKREALDLCQELGLGHRLVSTKPPRLAFVQRGGALHALPAASVLGIPTQCGPFIRSPLFSWSGKLRMAAEILLPRRRDEADESIGAFMTRRFGREAATYLAEPLLAGIHAGDVDRLSLAALFPRFAALERQHGSLIRAFRSERTAGAAAAAPGGARAADAGVFRSLPGGLSDLTSALVAALPAGSVHTSAAVTRLAGRGPFIVETATSDAIPCQAVVLATPAYAAAALVGDRDVPLATLLGAIPYASIATVALAYPREAVSHPLNGSGYVVPRVEANGIIATSWLSSKWPGRAPADRVLLRTFIGGARDPDALRLSDTELVARSLAAIRPVLGIGGDPLFTRVYRFERANAQHEVGHLDRVAAIERALGAHPGLFATGSGLRGVGIPDCVADGRATARQVVAWLARPSAATAIAEQERGRR